jgi:hypothetical protein
MKAEDGQHARSRLRLHWRAAVFFLVPFAVYLTSSVYHYLDEMWLHIFLTLTVVTGVHLLDRLVLSEEFQRSLRDLIGEARDAIQKAVEKQTVELVDSSRSLDAMRNSGVGEIYATRVKAGEDICQSLCRTDISSVRMLGISLNDFVQRTDENLGLAWDTLRKRLSGEEPVSESGLDVRLLLIDPRCVGARMRSMAESETEASLRSRLREQVESAATELHELQSRVSSRSNISFKCRLYRLPPTLFLVWCDDTAYVQPYHFWSARDNNTPVPILRYTEAVGLDYDYHREMKHHFDYIWEHASIDVSEHVEAAAVGTDPGIHKGGTQNVYHNASRAKDRMVHLLEHAQHYVVIQGISLHSFFTPGRLLSALGNAMRERGDQLHVTILLLNPDCEQAKIRSYRERTRVWEKASIAEFVEQGGHQKSDLYRHTEKSLDAIREFVHVHRNDETSKPIDLRVGLYSSAPSCFALLADHRVMIEQYHYGKIVPDATRLILGKDMPLFEYIDWTHPDLTEFELGGLALYAHDPLRMPYVLIRDHLDYVASLCQWIDLDRPPTSIDQVIA